VAGAVQPAAAETVPAPVGAAAVVVVVVDEMEVQVHRLILLSL
jgi:hypothetical protein